MKYNFAVCRCSKVGGKNPSKQRRTRMSMHMFKDHIIPFSDLTFEKRVGKGSAAAVYRAKLRKHTQVAVKSVDVPVNCYLLY